MCLQPQIPPPHPSQPGCSSLGLLESGAEINVPIDFQFLVEGVIDRFRVVGHGGGGDLSDTGLWMWSWGEMPNQRNALWFMEVPPMQVKS